MTQMNFKTGSIEAVQIKKNLNPVTVQNQSGNNSNSVYHKIYQINNYRSSLINTPLGKSLQDAQNAGQKIYNSSNKPDNETVKIDQFIKNPRGEQNGFIT